MTKDKYDPILLNKNQTAYMLGTSADVFARWNIAQEGRKGAEVFYDLRKVISIRIEQIKNQNKSTTLTEARTTIVKIKAKREQFEYDELTGRYYETEKAQAEIFEFSRYVRDGIQAIPIRVADSVASKILKLIPKDMQSKFKIDKLAKIVLAAWGRETHTIFNQLSDGGPKLKKRKSSIK